MAPVLKKVICASITVLMLFLWTACEPEGAGPSEVLLNRSDMLAGFGVAELDIMGLTEITVNSGQADGEKVTVYVDLKDSFGSRVKSGGVFRFELYEFVPRSSENMGKRLQVWPDIDLRQAGENNRYWRDFLRSYEFELKLDLGIKSGNVFILQATCITPEGRRLSNTFQLKYP